MPPGRTSPAYSPAPPTTLTEEEAAAIAAEQSAAYGSDYAPAPPVETAPATTPYGGAAPAPALEATYAPPPPAETPYGGAGAAPYAPSSPAPAPVTSSAPEWQSISPQETQTGNQRTVPGMTASPSDFYDDATAGNRANPIAPTWSSVSPQDPANAVRTPFNFTPSEGRDGAARLEYTTRGILDPVPTALESWTNADLRKANEKFAAGDLSTTNVSDQSLRDSFFDNLGRSLGLDPNRKDADMANQLVTNLSDMIGDATGTTARTALIDLPARALGIYGKGMQLARDEVAPRVAQAVGNQLGTAWGLTEDIYGPLGNTLRQLQSTSDPAGRGIAENVLDPAGSAKDNLVGGIGARFGDFSDWLNTREQERDRLTDEFQDRVEGVTDRGESPGDAIGDFLGFPLPSLGFQEPQMPEVDPHNPSPSWLLSPRLTAMQLGADLGSFMRSGVDTALEGAAATSTVETAEQAANRKAQQARGTAIRAQLDGKNPLQTAGAVAGSLLNLPPMPNVSLRAMFGDGDAPTAETAPPYAPADPSIPGKMGGISSNGSDSAPLVIQPAGNPLFPTDMPWAKGDASEPATGSTGTVQTASGALKGKQEQAKAAAQAAKDWLAGQSLPDVSMPSFDLPFGERGSGRPEMYQPSSPPAPSVGERLVDAATTGATWLDDQFISAAEGREMDELARLAIRQINPTVANGGAPLTMRRASPASGVVIDPNAMYMPLPPEESLMQRAGGAVRNAAQGAGQWAREQAADVSLPGRGGDYVRPYIPGETMPNAGNGDAPFTLRRSQPTSGVIVDPNAMYMPEPPEQNILQRAGNRIKEAISDVSLPDVTLPDVTLPQVTLPGQGGDPGSRWAPDDWRSNIPQPASSTGPGGNATTTDPLQTAFDAASAPRSATLPAETSAVPQNGYTWVKNANGDFLGVQDPATGEYVLFPEGATDADKQALVDSVLSGVPSSTAPGPATTSPTTSSTTDAAPATSSGTTRTSGTSSSGNAGGSTRSSGSTTGSTRRNSSTRSTSSTDDDWDAAPLKLDDFLQDFDGDGVVGKRDRAMGRKAFEQAKAARAKRQRGKGGKNSASFPFARQDSPIRSKVLGAIADSQGR